jgi:enamine deaminase RidA (YjgF/YER057c/UK114 family)
VGYARAIRSGDRVWVSGTTGTRPDGSVPDGAGPQGELAFDVIVSALAEVGARTSDVVAVRSYVVNIERDWEAVADALRARFRAVRPAMTMVEVARLMLRQHLVEIEVEAVVEGA